MYFLHVRLEMYVLPVLIPLGSFSPVLGVVLPVSMFLQAVDPLPTFFPLFF